MKPDRVGGTGPRRWGKSEAGAGEVPPIFGSTIAPIGRRWAVPFLFEGEVEYVG